MNLKIEIKNITKEQAIAFALFMRKVEYYGKIGQSGTIGLFADGDGNMRPTITTDLDLTEEQLLAYTEFALGTIETKNGNKIPVFDFDKIPDQINEIKRGK